jgi:hypothetical protein
MRQLAVSDRITGESKKLVGDAFAEFDDLMTESAAGGAMRRKPAPFVSAIMSAIGVRRWISSRVSLHRESATRRQDLTRSGRWLPDNFFDQ